MLLQLLTVVSTSSCYNIIVDETGVDEIGVDQTGVDEPGITPHADDVFTPDEYGLISVSLSNLIKLFLFLLNCLSTI